MTNMPPTTPPPDKPPPPVQASLMRKVSLPMAVLAVLLCALLVWFFLAAREPAPAGPGAVEPVATVEVEVQPTPEPAMEAIEEAPPTPTLEPSPPASP
jgi:hypothetical protein